MIRVLDYGAGQGGLDDGPILRNLLAQAPDGAQITVPGGVVCQVAGTLDIDKRVTLTGPGELRFTAGVEESPGVRISAPGSRVIGLQLSNPLELQRQVDGGRNTGVEIRCDDVNVAGCILDRWQNGVTVRAQGEFAHHVIAFNRIRNVLGAGGGPDSTSRQGEDRGDGIVTWGSLATIIGNIVTCKPGTDARIGIHAEALDTYQVTTGPHDNAMIVAANNIVYGRFRRGISFEGIKGGLIVGNAVADSTWWGLSSVNHCEAVTIANNLMIWTRTAGDNQGRGWGPVRAPIMVYGANTCTSVDNNQIVLAEGSAAAAVIAAQGAGADLQVVDADIARNRVIPHGGTATDGVYLSAATRPRVWHNRLKGHTARGVYGWNVAEPDIRGNEIEGGAHGVTNGGGGARPVILDNSIRGAVRGISTINYGTSPVRVERNHVRDAQIGLDLWGSSHGLVRGNITEGCAEPTKNIQSTVTMDGHVDWPI